MRDGTETGQLMAERARLGKPAAKIVGGVATSNAVVLDESGD
jgi:hypothetical protein